MTRVWRLGIARRKPLQVRAQATVAAILEAAVDVIDRGGWDHASTNRIATRAGVSIGSLYQYFPNKDAILAALFETHRHEVHEVIAWCLLRLADPNENVEAVLRGMFSALIDLHRKDPALTRVLSTAVPPCPPAEHRKDDATMTEILADVLRSRPDVRLRDPSAAAHVLSVATEALSIWLVHQAPSGFEAGRLLDEIVDMVCRYVLVSR
jgi:AcrR family transcriptional regulator